MGLLADLLESLAVVLDNDGGATEDVGYATALHVIDGGNLGILHVDTLYGALAFGLNLEGYYEGFLVVVDKRTLDIGVDSGNFLLSYSVVNLNLIGGLCHGLGS